MKKTLFAMMAVALMGGQAFADSYNVTDLLTVTDKLYIKNADITVNTSQTCSLEAQASISASTVIFDSNHVWNASGTSPIIWFSISKTDITATTATKENWIQELTSPGAQPITLFSGNFSLGDTTKLLGASKGASFELTDGLTVKYLGIINSVDTMEQGDIAILKSDTSYSLVGKVAAPVPEPATATLSLLALAGLAARRKRK